MVRLRSLGGVALACLGATAAAFACSAYSGGGGVPEEAGADAPAPPPAPPASVDLCAHTAPPGKPAVDDAPGVNVGDVVLAVDHFTFGTAVGGFDLDRSCTCDTRPGAAHDGGPSCAGPAGCDLDGGVDDNLGYFADTLMSFFDIASIQNGLVQAGRATTVLVIKNWNGQPNDPDVTVGVAISAGIHSDAGCPGATYDTLRGTYSPGWCGSDPWTVSTLWGSSDGDGGVIPRGIGPGYVSGGVLVAGIGGELGVPFGDVWGAVLKLGFVVATLGHDANGNVQATNGVLAGRATTHDLLVAFGTVLDPTGGMHGSFRDRLCWNKTQFGSLRTSLCTQGLDVSVSGADFQGVPCDGISAAAAFTARAAKLDGLHPPDVVPEACQPGADGQPDAGTVSYFCDR